MEAESIAWTVDVLLVEDDPAIAEMYAARLRVDGWTVSVATDGLQALQTAWRDQPRLVLLDVQLPRLDGLSVLEHLRRQPDLTQIVIMLSNSQAPEVVERALRSGAREFLLKSATIPSHLARRVAEALGSQQVRHSSWPAIAGSEELAG